MPSSNRSSLMSDHSFVLDDLQEPLINDPDVVLSRTKRRPLWYTRRRFVTRVALGAVFAVTITTLIGITLFPYSKQDAASSPHRGPPGYSLSTGADDHSTAASTEEVFHNTLYASKTATSYRTIPTLPSDVDETPPILPNVHDPQAVNAQTVCPGYTASAVIDNAYGFTAGLTLAGPACNVYGTDVVHLNLTVEYQSNDRLSIRITPAYISESNYSDYLIQPWYVPKPEPEPDATSSSSLKDLHFTWSNTPSFNFDVVRRSTGDIIFSTAGSKLVFEDQFVEFRTTLPQDWNLQGLGETIHSLRLLRNHNITIYAADAADPIDGNIYSAFPFYMETRYYERDLSGDLTHIPPGSRGSSSAEQVSYAHGVYLRNLHGQEILLRDADLTWRTIGGSLELYVFSGPSPPEVIKQYVTAAAGLPALQPYWAFGYHHCRWGYRNWSELVDIVDNFRNFNIPLETIWTDIDYMNQYRDFENDDNTFPYTEGQQFLSNLHLTHQHYVPIVDSAIYVPNLLNSSDEYEPFMRGNASDVFILNPDGSLYVGAVWPGFTAFPDWRSPNTQAWWTNEMMTWHSVVPWDGIWIDMSEVSSFCVGSCGTGKLSMNPVHPPFPLPGEQGSIIYDYPDGFDVSNTSEYLSASSASIAQASSNAAKVSLTATVTASSLSTSYMRTIPTPGVRNLDFPPYALNNVNGALPVHAVSPSAIHADGASEYSVHNLFGAEILNTTYNALLSVFPGKRPFIIGRSTSVGSGTKAGHWGGDNRSLFLYMAMSIPQALQMSLFGIPFFGVDTCGFDGNSDSELCSRWMQLSAFFPFYRNHNTLSANPQEPYVWASVAEASRIAMSIRYSLLPYMYTLFYHAHTTGSTVMRALAWEFFTDPSLAGIDRQFMLGGSLLITPVLTPLVTSVDGVFPGSKESVIWYDWYSHTAMPDYNGANVTIPAPLGHIPVYVRGGSILPLQEPAYTTLESRRNPWSLLVALDIDGSATGQLYVDDGESIEPDATLNVNFTVSGTSLHISRRGNYVDTNVLASITIMGMTRAPMSASLDSIALHGITYNESAEIARFTGLEDVSSVGAWSKSWSLTWSH